MKWGVGEEGMGNCILSIVAQARTKSKGLSSRPNGYCPRGGFSVVVFFSFSIFSQSSKFPQKSDPRPQLHYIRADPEHRQLNTPRAAAPAGTLRTLAKRGLPVELQLILGWPRIFWFEGIQRAREPCPTFQLFL